MKISATILAAGASKRMGNKNKLLLLVDNKPIIYLVCKSVLKSELDQTISGFLNSKFKKLIG